jgi:hypothetical protein
VVKGTITDLIRTRLPSVSSLKVASTVQLPFHGAAHFVYLTLAIIGCAARAGGGKAD